MAIGSGRPPEAGASARREYERRRAQREARARARLGGLGVMGARLLGEPQSTRAWRQGAESELEVAEQLARRLAGREALLLHDRRIPWRGRANIDHLAVGPGGVTVIDTKSARGRLELKRGGLLARRELLLVNGRDRTHLVDALERQLAAVRTVLGELEPELLGQVGLRGALCYPQIDGLGVLGQLRMRSGTIAIDGPRGVAKLCRRRGPLSLADVALIAATLGRRLPPA